MHASSPKQTSLFDDDTDPAAAPAATALVRALVDGDDPRTASRWQREFGKLSASVTALRRALQEALELRDAYQARVLKVFEPSRREFIDARRAWVLAADRVLLDQAALPKTQRLSARRRKHLTAFVVMQVSSLLGESDPDDQELAAIHDRWSDITLDESRELDKATAMAMLEELVGPEIAEHGSADDIEALIRRAHEHVEAQDRERDERRKTDARGAKARARREQAAKEVSQSVRDVYRKLASALHPDRETDHAERERKTALMQRANQAYERGDLLELLSMQISLIEADRGALARADDKRLQLYCQALREQQQALESEIAEVEAPVRIGLELMPGQRLPDRAAVLARVERDAKQVKRDAEGIRKDNAALVDPRRCGALVDELPVLDFAEFESWFEQAAVMTDAAKPRRRGKRQGRRTPRSRRA